MWVWCHLRDNLNMEYIHNCRFTSVCKNKTTSLTVGVFKIQEVFMDSENKQRISLYLDKALIKKADKFMK